VTNMSGLQVHSRRPKSATTGSPTSRVQSCCDGLPSGGKQLEHRYQGSVPSFAWVNVPVGPSGPSSAMRTASLAPSSTVSVP